MREHCVPGNMEVCCIMSDVLTVCVVIGERTLRTWTHEGVLYYVCVVVGERALRTWTCEGVLYCV